jgi:5-(aminomethyl)-3-furanmethanol phosphate kinase
VNAVNALSDLTVVKLGGSLLADPRLDAALQALARPGIVIVPGGGVFADAVRAAQGPLRFDDTAAHAMAILAMAQTALLLRSRCPALQLAATPATIAAAVAAGRPVCWQPTGVPDTEVGWHITSDSLAAWLAWQLGAARLVLVKAEGVPPQVATGGDDLQRWGDQGWVDAGFAAHAQPLIQRGAATVGLTTLAGLPAALPARPTAAQAPARPASR